ncbi:unnamed protein product, partial [Dibothriocephalus latus]
MIATQVRVYKDVNLERRMPIAGGRVSGQYLERIVRVENRSHVLKEMIHVFDIEWKSLIPVPIEPIRSVGSATKGSRKEGDMPTDQFVTNLAAIEEAIRDPQAYLASTSPAAS